MTPKQLSDELRRIRNDNRQIFLESVKGVGPHTLLALDERDTQDRIASALERIADALEAQAPVRGGLINE